MLEPGIVLRLELLELGRVAGREREQLQHVQPEEALRVEQAELPRDERTVVRAVHAVLGVAETAHELVVRLRHAGRGPTGVGDRVRESEPRSIWDHEVEVAQRVDHLEVVDRRAGVVVRKQQRGRAVMLRADMDELDGLPVDLGREMRHGVDAGFLRTPVESRAPLLDGVAQV